MSARLSMQAAALGLAMATSGCWSTTVASGQPAGATAAGWDRRWHSGAVFGTVELSGPYDLAAVCPGGWAEVHTETSFWNGLLILFTFDMYSTQTVSIRCAATEGPQLPAKEARAEPGRAPARR